jgi:hypothetical protein
MFYSLQKQTHVVVMCKNVTNMWCYLLFPPSEEEICQIGPLPMWMWPVGVVKTRNLKNHSLEKYHQNNI